MATTSSQSPGSGSEGFPTQILNIETQEATSESEIGKERTSILNLNTEALNEILVKAGDKNVVLISIAGPSRQGKSFLLGFLLRYLESLNSDTIDWFGHENKESPLQGFKWRNGFEPETFGIWMWSKPFFVKLEDGSECAVLLMDTQGTYDEYTTQVEWSKIVGLSLLTSSCLIFNFFNNLLEDTLLSLGAFMDYGLMTVSERESADNSHPFQKLLFLIRDWNMPAEFPYGAKGGMEFLKKKLEIKPGHRKEAIRIRESIQKCFEELSCFLMPEPGEKMKAKGYNGSIAGLNPQFIKQLEKFVSDFLDPDNLKVKMVGGKPISAQELGLLFNKYVQVFNSEDAMNPITMFEATCRVMNTNLVSKSVDTYRNSMQRALRKQSFLSDKEILNCHSKFVAKAIDDFDKSKKTGSPEIIQEYRQILVENLDKEFNEFKLQNSEKKLKIIQQSTQDVIEGYIQKMSYEMGETFINPQEFKSTSDTFKMEGINAFQEECSPEDPEILEKQVEKLKSSLTHEEISLQVLNDNRISEAEKLLEKLVKESTEMYLTSMKEQLDKYQHLPEENLADTNASKSAEALENYKKSEKPGDKNFQRKFIEDLKQELDSAFLSIKTENENRRMKFESEAKALARELLEQYENQMTVILDTVSTQEELTGEDSTCRKIILGKFEQADDRIPPSIIQLEIPELNTMLEKSFANILRTFIQNSRNLEAECQKAIGDSFLEFENGIQELLDERVYMRGEDFVAEYNSLKDHVMDEMLDKLEGIGIPKENFDQYLEELKTKVEESFDKWEQRNIQKQEHVTTKAQKDVTDSVSKYHQNVKQSMDTCRNNGDLDALHSQTKDSIIQDFESKYSNVHPSFLQKFLEDLENEMNAKYKDIEELFVLRKEELEAGTKAALTHAQKFYKEEFEKIFSNTDFLSPDALNDLHNEVGQLAISRCEKTLKQSLTPGQKEDLIKNLKTVYLRYKELNLMNMPTDPAIGIDLGTTFCCVGVYAKGKTKIIENNGKKTTPSYVAFKDTGVEVGEAAKNQAHEHPECTIYDAKRIIGRKFADPILQTDIKNWSFKVVAVKGNPKIEIGGKTYFPEQISALLLKDLKRGAEDYLGCEVKKAVITVPAYFNDGQRQATRDAGELAGLQVLAILNEPTAAAIAYGLQHKDLEPRNVLIYDLGGGTFDVAILRMSFGNIDVLAVDGDTHLGGEDFDNNLVEFAALEFQRQHGIDLRVGKNSQVEQERNIAFRILRRLKSECEDRKVNLSTCKKSTVSVDAIKNGIDLSVTVTKDKFEAMNATLFEKTIQIVERALNSAGINKSSIDDIVLVGGSTRIPKIQQLLSDYFGKALNKTINADEAVAYGAAIHAAILNGDIAKDSVDFTKIRDVVPMSLGVEILDGEFSIIIPKNTKIPVVLQQKYCTRVDNQTSVKVPVYQGENLMTKNNDKLGEFVLGGIPRAPAGHESIDVEMQVDDQGILHVSVVSCSTGGKNNLTISEYKNRLSRTTIQKLLSEGTSAAA